MKGSEKMKAKYIHIWGGEVTRNESEKSEYYTIKDMISNRILLKTKDEKEAMKKLQQFKGKGYLLSIG